MNNRNMVQEVQPPVTPNPPPIPPQVPPAPQPVKPQQPTSMSMIPQRTIILIGILALLTVTLVLVAFKMQQKQQHIPIVPTPTPKISMAHTLLSLSQDTATPSSVDITIDTTSNKASAVQVEIAYDPTVITDVKVSQGTFFPQAAPLLNLVDTKDGRISYAIAIPTNADGVGGKGTVAVITYKKVPGVKKDITFNFLPKTKVTQLGILDTILEKTINLTIPATSAATTGTIISQ